MWSNVTSNSVIDIRGATGAARAPKPGKIPIMAANRRRCRHLLFFKIEVRPRSCRSYYIWRPWLHVYKNKIWNLIGIICLSQIWFDASKKKLNSASLGNSMASLTPFSLNTWSWLQTSLLTSSFDLFSTTYLSVFAAPWLWILFKQLVHFKTASATSIWGKRVSGL